MSIEKEHLDRIKRSQGHVDRLNRLIQYYSKCGWFHHWDEEKSLELTPIQAYLAFMDNRFKRRFFQIKALRKLAIICATADFHRYIKNT